MIDTRLVSDLKIIEPLSYAANKQALITLIKSINPDTILYESTDEMVLLEAFAYEMTYRDEAFNARMRATLPSYAKGENLDTSSLNFYGLTRLVGESDEAFYSRSLASLQQSVTTGSDDSYIAHTKGVDVRITDVYPYRSGEGETTIVWHSHVETIIDELTAIQSAIETVIFDTSIRSLCATRQTVKRAEVVYFDISLTLFVASVFAETNLISLATSSLRDFFARHPISAEVRLSKLMSIVHLSDVAYVEIASPATDLVIASEQVAVLRDINISIQGDTNV